MHQLQVTPLARRLEQLAVTGGGLLPVATLGLALGGLAWLDAHGLGLVGWVVFTALALLSAVLGVVRARQLLRHPA